MEWTRRRRIVRRLTIALVIATTILYVAHWFFSRGVDQRLVGMWSVTGTSHKFPAFWRLDSYGRGELYIERDRKRLYAVRWRWQVRESTLQMSSFNQEKSFVTRIKRDWEILRSKLAPGRPSVDSYENYEIVKIDPDFVILLSDETHNRLELRRLNE